MEKSFTDAVLDAKKDNIKRKEEDKKLEKYELEIQAWLEFSPKTLSQLKKFYDSMISIYLGGKGMQTVMSKYKDPFVRHRIDMNYKVNYPK